MLVQILRKVLYFPDSSQQIVLLLLEALCNELATLAGFWLILQPLVAHRRIYYFLLSLQPFVVALPLAAFGAVLVPHFARPEM